MAYLRKKYGKQDIKLDCGKWAYLDNSIQTLVILFKDGRSPVTIYFDFSKFGAF